MPDERRSTTAFDPDAAATAPGVFGLDQGPERAAVRLLPVPFDATCSGARGTAAGPEAIRGASRQVDLLDPHFGSAWRVGIHMEEPWGELSHLNDAATALATSVIAAGGPTSTLLADHAREVDDLSRRRTDHVESWTRERLAEGRTPGIVGGDHSCPLGALRAASAETLSILHVDAHHDLRERYEGFTESHASIMYNVLTSCPGVDRIVQVGIRDYCEEERDRARSEPRVRVHYWHDWNAALCTGTGFAGLVEAALADLGERVWVSFDVDGLDPGACPGTGTPVPGGPSFDQAAFLLHALAGSGRKVAGFDLCETGPGPIDAGVGARLLYKLCGLAGGTS